MIPRFGGADQAMQDVKSAWDEHFSGHGGTRRTPGRLRTGPRPGALSRAVRGRRPGRPRPPSAESSGPWCPGSAGP